jgi:hypothetical protein
MTGGKVLDKVTITLRNYKTQELFPMYINIFDNSLSEKWLIALNHLLKQNYHLEKNYCFMGFVDSDRNGTYILNQINIAIQTINNANIGYSIDDHFTMQNVLESRYDPTESKIRHRQLKHERMNDLHRYFEDLQGVSGRMSQFAERATSEVKWHIRQLNLLCHEFESWALSYKKEVEAPEWRCPSMLMCWLNAPRFTLDEKDHELFGIETINRKMGAVYVGVNKAVGKHHWEVYHDEGRDSRIDELTTSTLRSQTEAAGDFDIEWGRSADKIASRQRDLDDFAQWLSNNGFDPQDKNLTLGFPQIGEVDLKKSFGTISPFDIWPALDKHLDVYSVETSDSKAIYDYHWSQKDYIQVQTEIIRRGHG